MGRDKALLAVDGEPMARRVAAALDAAGAEEVIAVGGDAPALAAAGLTAVPDDPSWIHDVAPSGAPPGAAPGPLVGVVTALGALATDVVLVVACDLVHPTPAAMVATIAALVPDVGPDGAAEPADLAVPHDGARPQWLHAAWRREARLPLRAALTLGERSVHGAVTRAGLRITVLRGLDPQALADADVPGELPRRMD